MKTGFKNEDQIRTLTSVVTDNGRRGEPMPGCDCMRCFGYCMVNRVVAERETVARQEEARVRREEVLPWVSGSF